MDPSTDFSTLSGLGAKDIKEPLCSTVASDCACGEEPDSVPGCSGNVCKTCGSSTQKVSFTLEDGNTATDQDLIDAACADVLAANNGVAITCTGTIEKSTDGGEAVITLTIQHPADSNPATMDPSTDFSNLSGKGAKDIKEPLCSPVASDCACGEKPDSVPGCSGNVCKTCGSSTQKVSFTLEDGNTVTDQALIDAACADVLAANNGVAITCTGTIKKSADGSQGVVVLTIQHPEDSNPASSTDNTNLSNTGAKEIAGFEACPVLKGQDVVEGTFEHAAITKTSSTDNDDCHEQCTLQPECTAWVRQPSIGLCFMSKQTGVVRFESDTDRDTGLACRKSTALKSSTKNVSFTLEDGNTATDQALIDAACADVRAANSGVTITCTGTIEKGTDGKGVIKLTIQHPADSNPATMDPTDFSNLSGEGAKDIKESTALKSSTKKVSFTLEDGNTATDQALIDAACADVLAANSGVAITCTGTIQKSADGSQGVVVLTIQHPEDSNPAPSTDNTNLSNTGAKDIKEPLCSPVASDCACGEEPDSVLGCSGNVCKTCGPSEKVKVTTTIKFDQEVSDEDLKKLKEMYCKFVSEESSVDLEKINCSAEKQESDKQKVDLDAEIGDSKGKDLLNKQTKLTEKIVESDVTKKANGGTKLTTQSVNVSTFETVVGGCRVDFTTKDTTISDNCKHESIVPNGVKCTVSCAKEKAISGTVVPTCTDDVWSSGDQRCVIGDVNSAVSASVSIDALMAVAVVAAASC